MKPREHVAIYNNLLHYECFVHESSYVNRVVFDSTVLSYQVKCQVLQLLITIENLICPPAFNSFITFKNTSMAWQDLN